MFKVKINPGLFWTTDYLQIHVELWQSFTFFISTLIIFLQKKNRHSVLLTYFSSRQNFLPKLNEIFNTEYSYAISTEIAYILCSPFTVKHVKNEWKKKLTSIKLDCIHLYLEFSRRDYFHFRISRAPSTACKNIRNKKKINLRTFFANSCELLG